MNAPELIHLTLRSPIEYVEAPLVPFAGFFPAGDPAAGTHAAEEAREFLFRFELDQEQAARIDPDPAAFPGELVFAGRRGGGREIAGQGAQSVAGRGTLPEGQYAFVQERRELGREECVAMAIEQQKDGLWERLRLGNLLYIRYLFEDGSPVTQLFRPCD